jgi:hypothetical protein
VTTVRRQGWRKTMVAHAGGQQVGWSSTDCLGGGFLGSGEIPIGSSNTDAVKPVDVTFLPEGP